MNIGSLEDILSAESQMLVLAILMAFTFSLAIAIIALPGLIKKMREGGMLGRDVNKPGNVRVPELGGIAALFAFSISLSLVIGIEKLVGDIFEPPYLAAISVFFIASMIGLIDDISNIKQRVKAIAVVFASLPLLLVHFKNNGSGIGVIDTATNAFIGLPFGYQISLHTVPLVYWFVLVPMGVTGVANAMNMSAGYNGLESGQIAIVSGVLLTVSAFSGTIESVLIFASLTGAALGLFMFNRHPARVFIGDIGTLGLGAAIAAGAVIGGIEAYGLIAIAPAFYEAGATFYYSVVRKVPDRRHACHNPVIRDDGTPQPPKGAERYTLAYWLLSRRPMTEKKLVRVILTLYAVAGAAAVVLSVL